YVITITAPARRGRGYGTEATCLVLAYAFAHLDLAAVQLTVEATNRRAIACYHHCGFVPFTLGRRLGQNHYGMLCANPERYTLPDEPIPPTLVVADPTSRTLTLRKAEAA